MDHSTQPEPSIQTLSTREIYRNPWMVLREDQILRSNGQSGIYGVVDKDDSAIIIPLDTDPSGQPRIWLVEQFRYTVQERCIELPQGGWEEANVDPEQLARGELREEIGLEAATMNYLGTLWIAYGFTKQRQHVFLAQGLTHTATERDPEEHDLLIRPVTVTQFEDMILTGAIRDNCTLSAWALYLIWKAKTPTPEG